MKKRVFAVVSALVLLVSFFSTGSLHVIAADDTDGKFSSQELRLNTSTSGLVLPISENTHVLLADRFNNVDQEGSTVYEPEGKIAFYYSEEASNASNISVLTKFEGTDVSMFYNDDETLANKVGLSNNRHIVYFEGDIDTSVFTVGQQIYIYDAYIKKNNSDRYAAMDGITGKSRRITMVAPTNITLGTDDTEVIYGNSARLTATVGTTYTGTGATTEEIISGKLTFYIDGTEVGYVNTSSGIGSIEIPASMINTVKSYDVTVEFTPANPTKSYPSSTEGAVTVRKRPITIKPEDVNLRVGDTFPTGFAVELKAGSFAFSDSLSTLGTLNFNSSVTDTTAPASGNITILDQDAIKTNNSNYEITFQTGSLTVSAVNTAPIVSNVSYTGREPITKENVTITFDVADDNTLPENLIITITDSDGNTIQKSQDGSKVTFTVEKNDTYKVIAEDTEGLTSTPVNIVVTNIDKVLPDITVSGDSTSNPVPDVSAELVLDVSDNKELSEVIVEFPDGTTTKRYPVTGDSETVRPYVNQNGDYTITVKDKAGNVKQTVITVDNVIIPATTKTEFAVSDIVYGNAQNVHVEVSPLTNGENVALEDICKGKVILLVDGVRIGEKTVVDGACDIEIPADKLDETKEYIVRAVFKTDDTTKSTDSEDTQTFLVKPRPITVKVKDVEVQKNAPLPSGYELELVEGTFAGGDGLSMLDPVEYGVPVTDTGTAGTYTVTVNNKAAISVNNPNYVITFRDGNLKVNAVNEAPVVDNVSDLGNDPREEVAISFDVSDDTTLPENMEITVIDPNGEPVPDDKVNVDGSRVTVIVEENGIYTITVKDEEDLESIPVQVEVTNVIVPATTKTEVTADDIIYGDSQTVHVTVDKLTDGENVEPGDICKGSILLYLDGELLEEKAVVDGACDIEIDLNKLSQAKEYSINAVFKPDDAAKTTTSEKRATFNVKPRAITVKVKDVVLDKGALLPSVFELELVDGTFVGRDGLSQFEPVEYSVPVTDADTVGTWDISVINSATIIINNPNYTITFRNGQLKVNAVSDTGDNENQGETGNVPDTPQTGDTTPVALYVMLFVAALAVLAFGVVTAKKRHE